MDTSEWRESLERLYKAGVDVRMHSEGQDRQFSLRRLYVESVQPDTGFPMVFKRHLEEGVGLEPDALVFPSPTGAPLRYRNFMRRVWRPTLEDLELPDVGVHVLRHSAAAALIQSGASATAVQKILGHRSAAFTLTVYGHIFDTDLDLVAERLDEASVDGQLAGIAPKRSRQN